MVLIFINLFFSHTFYNVLVLTKLLCQYIFSYWNPEILGIHSYLQPHKHSPLLSHSLWLAAHSLAACTCGPTVNQIQTFHSSALLKGLHWPLFWPCGPFYWLRKEQQKRDGSIVHTEMKSRMHLTFDYNLTLWHFRKCVHLRCTVFFLTYQCALYIIHSLNILTERVFNNLIIVIRVVVSETPL